MRPTRLVCPTSDEGRRFIAAFSLILYVLTASGAPLSVPGGTIPTGSERFPCENHGCGCPDADHCWRSCCCMTLTEKLAWAEKNGVEPPEFIVASAQVGSARRAEPGGSENVATAKSSPDKAASCCSQVNSSPEKPASCCAQSPARQAGATESSCCASKRAKPAPGQTILASLACRGLLAQWTAACIAIPVSVLSLQFDGPAHEIAVAAILPADSPGDPPPAPPPRAS